MVIDGKGTRTAYFHDASGCQAKSERQIAQKEIGWSENYKGYHQISN